MVSGLKSALRFGYFLLAFVFGSAAFLDSAHAIQIDKFNGGAQSFSVAGVGGSGSSFVMTSAALGGSRMIRATSLAVNTVNLGVNIAAQQFHQDEDFSAQAETTIIWDGAKVSGAAINYTGLGGIDLTADGASNFKLNVNFDYPGSQALDIIISVFDANDPLGATVSYYKTTIAQAAFSPLTLTIPFAAPDATLTTNPANLRRVGAITLSIKGQGTSNDIQLSKFGTDGDCSDLIPLDGNVKDVCGVCGGDGTSCWGCDHVPNSGKVIDACGQCGGDNSSCKDCNGVPNGGALLDLCGVCNGNNSTCKDCLGVPNGSAKLDACGLCNGPVSDAALCAIIQSCPSGNIDLCGVCDGNNACLDCAGVPNGTATIDCCGVCGGDGNSCPDKCTIYNLKKTKANAKKALQKLYNSVVKYSNQEWSCSHGRHAQAKKRIKKAQTILKQNTTVLSTLIGDKLKLCNTIYCTKTSLTSVLQSLKVNTKALYNLSRQAQYGAGGVCRRSRTTSGSAPSSTSKGTYAQAQNSFGQIPSKVCN